MFLKSVRTRVHLHFRELHQSTDSAHSVTFRLHRRSQAKKKIFIDSPDVVFEVALVNTGGLENDTFASHS